jgi:hypothetical protein
MPPKKKPGRRRKPGNRKGASINIWVTQELRDAVDALVEQERRTLTEEVCIAIEKHLREKGFWPPPEEP